MNQKLTNQEIQNLLQSDEEQLLEQLGMRAAVVTQDLARSAEFNPAIVAADVTAMGIKDDLKVLGQRLLRRWERSAYEIICGADADDLKLRNEVRGALRLGDAAAVGGLAAALISMGLMPALAPIVAAILVKKFLAPTLEEFCKVWSESLAGRG